MDLKRNKKAKCDYERRSSWLEWESNDVIWLEDSFPSFVLVNTTIIEEEDECLSESAPSFAIEFAETQLQAAKREDR